MIIKVVTNLFIETDEDPEQVCATLDGGLDSALRSFPSGAVIQADVEHYEELTQEQISEMGFEE